MNRLKIRDSKPKVVASRTRSKDFEIFMETHLISNIIIKKIKLDVNKSVDSALIEQIHLKQSYNNSNNNIKSRDIYGGVNATTTKRSGATSSLMSPKKKNKGIGGIGPTKL